MQAPLKRHLFSPSQLRSQTNVLLPTPTPRGAYLPNRVGLPMPPRPLWSRRQLRGHCRERALPRRLVSSPPGPRVPTDLLACKVPQDVGEGSCFKCSAFSVEGQAVGAGLGKTPPPHPPAQNWPLSSPIPPFGGQAQLRFLRRSPCLASRLASGIRS